MPNLTTFLDAVNTVLGAVGEAPVSSLVNASSDALIASNIVEEISREVQAEGFNFNTEDDVPLQTDLNGFILLASNVLSVDVDPSRYTQINPVQRGSRLYDAKNHTAVFKEPLEARVVYLLEFTDLPETARRYITVRAARVFHDRFVGSNDLHRFTAEDEARARLAFDSENTSSGDWNIFQRDGRVLRRFA